MNLVKTSSVVSQILRQTPFITSNVRSYAFKSDLKIKWVHPGKISCIDPRKSGDLEPMPPIDQSQYRLEFQKCKELEDADDTIKKLFSLEFAPRYKSTEVYIRDTLSTVQRHPLDKGSSEATIARWTGVIRAMQELMEKYPRNKFVKIQLKELIDKRKKQLKYLRRWDYKRFEWVIDTLNIVYKSPPNEFHWVTRRGSLRKLTDKYCDDVRNERLTAYQLKLESEQPGFLEGKIRALEFIRQEQQDCGVDVTVTQEDIDSVKKQLEELLQQRAEQTKIEEE